MEVKALDPQAAENKELLDLLMSDAKDAVHRGDSPRLEGVVNEGDAVMPPMVVKTFEDSGTALIYDIATGEPSRTSINMLPFQIKKRDIDGRRMFTHIPPTTLPKRGTLKCLLHPDVRAEHPEFDEWGLNTCQRELLPNITVLGQHMKQAHPEEWKSIQEHKATLEKQAEIDRQERLIIAAATGQLSATGKKAG